jgi:hypothetical protein
MDNLDNSYVINKRIHMLIWINKVKLIAYE